MEISLPKLLVIRQRDAFREALAKQFAGRVDISFVFDLNAPPTETTHAADVILIASFGVEADESTPRSFHLIGEIRNAARSGVTILGVSSLQNLYPRLKQAGCDDCLDEHEVMQRIENILTTKGGGT